MATEMATASWCPARGPFCLLNGYRRGSDSCPGKLCPGA
jgi:hypothetical protein